MTASRGAEGSVSVVGNVQSWRSEMLAVSVIIVAVRVVKGCAPWVYCSSTKWRCCGFEGALEKILAVARRHRRSGRFLIPVS
jgi:hypothetical protein